MSEITDTALVAELGRRVAQHRIARSLTQDEFAARAGVGRSTVQRLEGGESIQLTSFVKLLRALEALDGLDALLTPEIRSPLADLAREQRQRQRVRHRTSPKREAPAPAAPWVWGDEPGAA
jgi:transcriptional regulator with XRE-family HTH domain